MPFLSLVAAIILVTVIAVTLSSRYASGPTKSAVQRALSTFDLQTGGGAERLYLWQNAYKMIMAKPILGWGPETFGTYSTRFNTAAFVHYELEVLKRPKLQFQNRPHSDILQVGTSAGLLDVLAYLALLGAYFFFALRRLLAMKLRDSVIANSPGKTGVKQPPYGLFDQALLIGIIAGLVGYFAQIQFSFSTVGVSPIVWLLIALTFTVGDTRGQTGDRRPETGEFNLSVFPRPILIVFVLFVLFVLSIAAFFSVRQLVADFYFDQGVTAIEVPDSYTAGQAFDTAIGLNPHEADYSNFAGNIFIEVAKTSNDADAAMIALSTAVFYLDKATALNPDMPGYHYNLGNAKYYYSQLLGIDKTVAENTMKEALRQYRIAVTGDPFNPDIRFNLAGAYLRFSQKQQAIAQLKAGLALDPNRTVARETLKKLEAKQQ